MFVLSVSDCVLGAPHIQRGNLSQQEQCVHDRGVPNAGNFYLGMHILWAGGTFISTSLKDSLTL